MAKRGRPRKKDKITPIRPDVELELDGEKNLAWYRSKLDAVRQFLWDKCMEGLNNTKAMGRWPELMKKLEELVAYVEITDASTELVLDFDVVATREVASA